MKDLTQTIDIKPADWMHSDPLIQVLDFHLI